MGILESIFDKLGFVKKNKYKQVINFLDGNGSIYSQFGNNIYASDVVQVAIYSIVKEMKTLNVCHYKTVNGEEQFLYDQVQKVLENPNPLMTTTDYIEKLVWNLFLNYNAFSYPLWRNGQLVSLTPLQPTNVEFYQTTDGQMRVIMKFRNGYEADLEYDRLIHIRYKYSVNDVMGGNEKGQPDHESLLKVLQLNDQLVKALAKSMRMNMGIQGVMRVKSNVKAEDSLKWLREFEQKVEEYDSAILPTNWDNEISFLNKQIQLLDKTVLEYLDEKVFRYIGTSAALVNCNYNQDEYNAVFHSTLQPLAIAFSQAHTKGIFSGKESFGYGHKIVFEENALLQMNVNQRIEYIKLNIDTASIYKNEVRRLGGLKPLVELNGQLAISSNQQNAQNNKKDEDKKVDIEEEDGGVTTDE